MAQKNRDTWDAVTTKRMTTRRRPTVARMPLLTIVCHPDLSRVGDVALLTDLAEGAQQAISRLEPLFVPTTAREARALEDPFLSRRPLWLKVDKGGKYSIARDAQSPPVRLDGAPLGGRREITPDELHNGVVLNLAGRVLLLLHTTTVGPNKGEPELGLVGLSDQIRSLRSRIGLISQHQVPVLIRGETGVGKELVAQAIHQQSPRASQPLVAVNMAAIPPSTAVSQLFGHLPGSFTGARGRHRGYFGQADGGTLFLDEIGQTPTQIQGMLLRVLETGEVQPVGSTTTEKVDVRLIAATDADLDHSNFSTPLLHRISGFQVQVPPLRQRRVDIAPLLVHFLHQALEQVGAAHILDYHEHPWLTVPVVEHLLTYDWPGNARQLRNAARHLGLAHAGNPEAQLDADLAALLPVEEEPAIKAPQPRRPADIDHETLVEALRLNDWRLEPTATHLRISRTSLYAMIERDPLIRQAKDLNAQEITAAKVACNGDLRATARQLEVSLQALKRQMKALAMRHR